MSGYPPEADIGTAGIYEYTPWIGKHFLLVEHDLFGKTGFYPRITSGGRLLPDHANERAGSRDCRRAY